MDKQKLLKIDLESLSKKQILEKTVKSLQQPDGFFHIVSINPENMVVAQKNAEFKKVIDTAQIKIIDGVGVIVAGKLLGVPLGERITGVDLMKELIAIAHRMRLRVLLLGGRPNLANSLANCYQKNYPQADFRGVQGVKNIKNPDSFDEKEIFHIVSAFKPHLVFAAFGSPEQELWLARHKDQFKGMVCMGVGGSFDFLSGEVKRAPLFLRKIGLEWLYRLVNQPWRWKRQLRLIEFVELVLRQRLGMLK